MQGLGKLSARLGGVNSVDALCDLFAEIIGELGYAGFDAWSLKSGTIDNTAQGCNFLVKNYGIGVSHKYTDRYIRDGWLQMDPVVAEMSRVSSPFEYIEFLQSAKKNSSVLWQLTTMKLFSVKRAWLVPLNTVGYLRGMTAYTRGNKNCTAEQFAASHDEIHLMCVKFMARCVELHEVPIPVPVDLAATDIDLAKITRREIDCLHWTARGKTNLEIGGILSVSENTVRYHMKNAFKKLDVKTRARAVTKALNVGIINL